MTNQFTDEQVEAGAKAYWLASEREIHDKPITWEWDKEERRRYMWAARQVLAGVAPQAESEELAWYKAAAKHSADSMAEAYETLQMLADRVDPFVFDELSSVLDDQPLDYETGDVIGKVAPVQPSSTVDEGKLTQAIYDELMTDDAVSEVWSNGKVMATARRLAKFAVVEAIGGERRNEVTQGNR